MMKNKNGFTLIELMATLAIMAILVVIIVPVIINIRDDIVEDSYENKKTNIFNAAKDWAYDNLGMITIGGKCTYVIVDELIKKGYIAGDSNDKKEISDPRDGSSMNKLEVCVTANYKDVTDLNGNSKRILEYNAEFKQ